MSVLALVLPVHTLPQGLQLMLTVSPASLVSSIRTIVRQPRVNCARKGGTPRLLALSENVTVAAQVARTPLQAPLIAQTASPDSQIMTPTLQPHAKRVLTDDIPPL